ncbi:MULTISPECIES: DUF1801 domain-containing protein [Virgibacillus]|uniref:DUF1801 domain-containing protein n=1 Tax=Virgibacillus dokdonensis TaxID=302167 RepID=A0ABU7VAB1_9BACI|nr:MULTISPECIES: DUF1801 domain-containing protein [Virgibacillus]
MHHTNEVSNYINNVEDRWKDAFVELKKTIDQKIPDGFELVMQYGMPSYVVTSIYLP